MPNKGSFVKVNLDKRTIFYIVMNYSIIEDDIQGK